MQTIEEACRSLLRGNVDMVGFDMEWWTQFKTGVAPRQVALIQLCYDLPQQEDTSQAVREAASPRPSPLQPQQNVNHSTSHSSPTPEPPCKRSCLDRSAGEPIVPNRQAQRPQCHCLLLHISRTGGIL